MSWFSDTLTRARQKLSLSSKDQHVSSQPWPDPAGSTGEVVDYILDKKTHNIRFTCWEAVGPARDKWKVLWPQIRDYVSDHDGTMKGDGFAGDLCISFYLIGQTRNTALPTVVFRSNDPTSRNRARDVVDRSRIMESHPGIGLGVMPGRTIHRMAGEDDGFGIGFAPRNETVSADESSNRPQQLVSSLALEEAFGRRLWIEGHDGISRRLATGALILQIEDRVVQITVGHVFDNVAEARFPPVTPYEAPTTANVDFDGMAESLEEDGLLGGSRFSDTRANDGDQASTSTFMSGVLDWLRRPGDWTLSLNGKTPMQSKLQHLLTASNGPDIRAPQRTNMNCTPDIYGSNLVQVGRLFDVSESGDLDYALVELDGEFRSGLNRIKFGMDVFEGWLSVTTVRDIAKEHNSSVAITTWTSSKGHALGNLSATPVYLRLSGTNRFQEVFRVNLNVNVAQGDCGSPIVDRIYGHFYGHIVAGVIGTGEAYMVAGARVMEDIELRHQQKAYLAPPVPITGIDRELELQEQRQGIRGMMHHLSPDSLPRYERDASFQTIDFASKRYFTLHPTAGLGSDEFFQDVEIMSRYMRIGDTTTVVQNQKSTSASKVSRPSSSPSFPSQIQAQEAARRVGITQGYHTEASSSHSRQQSGLRQSSSKALHGQSDELAGNTFQALFLTKIPLEIRLEIMSWLQFPDILHLRLVSRDWNDFITSQDSGIASSHLRRPHIPSLLIKLFPSPSFSSMNLGYVAGLWHRYSTACQLASSIAEWITRDQFLRRAPKKRLEFSDREVRMRRRLVPFILLAGHYLETYCHELLLNPPATTATDEVGDPSGEDYHETIERNIMAQYNDMTLLQMRQFFPILLAFQDRRLRPASYLGRVERSLRGFQTVPVAEDVQVTMLYLGGLHMVKRLTRMDTEYEKLALDAHRWFVNLSARQEQQSPDIGSTAESCVRRRGVKLLNSGTGRRNQADDPEPSNTSSTNNKRDPRGKAPAGPILLPTSLAESKWKPLGSHSTTQLDPTQINFLMSKLSKVTKSRIWVPTSETVLLERGVIGRAQDIKQSAAVLQELISPEPSCMDVFFYERGLKGELDFGATA